MKYVITESQSKSFQKMIQGLIDDNFETIKEESEDWGMDEMDAIHEIGAVDKIEIDRVEHDKVLNVYVNIYLNYPRYVFGNILDEIEYRIRQYIPKINIIQNEIKDERTSGPGIDW